MTSPFRPWPLTATPVKRSNYYSFEGNMEHIESMPAKTSIEEGKGTTDVQ